MVLGTAYAVAQSGFLGSIDAGWLRSIARCQVDGLIGTDILWRYDIALDVPQGAMTFSQESSLSPGRKIPMNGANTIESNIDGAPIDLIFDTGAQLSYVPEEHVAGRIPSGRFTDFYPLIGEFDTPTYLVDISLGGEEFRITAGVLPPTLGALIPPGMGILGNEVLHARPMLWAPRRNLLSFLPRSDQAHFLSCSHRQNFMAPATNGF